ncbi:relaxase/mobilization nuclease domain-containing protein [Caulobacter sp. LjRoot300]|uniref:relaxase/mobilization nuclease domain-containing protein n=1 Tax=Caulobacter sp. LjRoot300 TaxID=3342321 RepID=UPI003ECEB154
MSEFDDEFLLRPGRVGFDRSAKPARFLGQVRRAVEAAGDAGPGRRAGPRGRLGGGLGRGAGRGRTGAAANRRVVVKSRIVRQSGSRYRAAPLSRHIAYLQREGVSRDDTPARMFDARGDGADVAAFAERCEGDRHHFRLIVSPENAADLADLRAFCRDLMGRAEQDLGTRLDWVAIDHWNTDNPHLHVLVRGRAEDGKDLVIAGDYLARGLRERASQLVTLELGPRTQREIDAGHDADVAAERWTRLDRTLVAAAHPGDRVVDLRRDKSGGQDDARLLGRAAHLAKLGLAQAEGPGRWRLAEDLEARLRDLSVRGDIIKTYHQAMARGGRHPTPERLVIHGQQDGPPVLGRLVERGLHDELAGSAYVLIDGLDGRQHHLVFPHLADTTDAPTGAIVERRAYVDRDGVARQALAVRSDLSVEAQVEARGATWLDRQLLKHAPDDVAAGFASEVAEAMSRRAGVLVGRGLASVREGRLAPVPGLLATLQAQDLEAAAARLARETGRSVRSTKQGEAVEGVYRRRIDLASGRYAVLDDGLGFRLAPWRPALEAHRGLAVGGVLEPGGMTWTLGRTRGPGL